MKSARIFDEATEIWKRENLKKMSNKGRTRQRVEMIEKMAWNGGELRYRGNLTGREAYYG